jgi:hypothetical protein
MMSSDDDDVVEVIEINKKRLNSTAPTVGNKKPSLGKAKRPPVGFQPFDLKGKVFEDGKDACQLFADTTAARSCAGWGTLETKGEGNCGLYAIRHILQEYKEHNEATKTEWMKLNTKQWMTQMRKFLKYESEISEKNRKKERSREIVENGTYLDSGDIATIMLRKYRIIPLLLGFRLCDVAEKKPMSQTMTRYDKLRNIMLDVSDLPNNNFLTQENCAQGSQLFGFYLDAMKLPNPRGVTIQQLVQDRVETLPEDPTHLLRFWNNIAPQNLNDLNKYHLKFQILQDERKKTPVTQPNLVGDLFVFGSKDYKDYYNLILAENQVLYCLFFNQGNRHWETMGRIDDHNQIKVLFKADELPPSLLAEFITQRDEMIRIERYE